jgi:hypothetical protein
VAFPRIIPAPFPCPSHLVSFLRKRESRKNHWTAPFVGMTHKGRPMSFPHVSFPRNRESRGCHCLRKQESRSHASPPAGEAGLRSRPGEGEFIFSFPQKWQYRGFPWIPAYAGMTQAPLTQPTSGWPPLPRWCAGNGPLSRRWKGEGPLISIKPTFPILPAGPVVTVRTGQHQSLDALYRLCRWNPKERK